MAHSQIEKMDKVVRERQHMCHRSFFPTLDDFWNRPHSHLGSVTRRDSQSVSRIDLATHLNYHRQTSVVFNAFIRRANAVATNTIALGALEYGPTRGH